MMSDVYETLDTYDEYTFTARANGFVYYEAEITNSNMSVLRIMVNGFLRYNDYSYNSNKFISSVIALVRPGDVVNFGLTVNHSNVVGRFYYTVGEAKRLGLI